MTGPAAFAHRLDEYLEATTISVERDRVHAQIRLTPGVAVFPAALRSIDTDADRVISQPERRAYAAEVLRDLSFMIDGSPLRPRLISMTFPKVEEMKEGRGEIQLEFYADLPRGGPNRRLVYENRDQSRISAYLVNCLVPRDPGASDYRAESKLFPIVLSTGLRADRRWFRLAVPHWVQRRRMAWCGGDRFVCASRTVAAPPRFSRAPASRRRCVVAWRRRQDVILESRCLRRPRCPKHS